jgi:radical SAM protein with 4Fe4S-binding SPASM domain
VRHATITKFQRLSKSISTTYSNLGLTGLVTASTHKFANYCIPYLYKSKLGQFYHPKLQTAFLELTNNCNLSCKMCNYQSSQHKTGFMSKQLFEKCLNELSEIGIGTLCLHFGGESLVHPQFREFLELAISKRDKGGIGSVGWTENGMLFNQTIADLVIALELDFINFSIDGIGELNDKIRIGSNYSIIEKNIKYLIEKRGKSKKPVVIINVVDYGKNEAEKLSIYREWIDIVDGIDLIPSILPDNSWEIKDASSSNLKMIPPPPYCHFAFNTIAISWAGLVTGCCLDYTFAFNMGDVNQNSIKNVWSNENFSDLRKRLALNKFASTSICKTCEFWKINFDPCQVSILDGNAVINYGYIYRKIRKTAKK